MQQYSETCLNHTVPQCLTAHINLINILPSKLRDHVSNKHKCSCITPNHPQAQFILTDVTFVSIQTLTPRHEITLAQHYVFLTINSIMSTE